VSTAPTDDSKAPATPGKPPIGGKALNPRAQLTNAQLRSLAKRHLSGLMACDLVGFAGLNIDQVRATLRSERMKQFLESEQEHLDTTAVRIRNNMSYGIEDSVNRMKTRGAGSDGPQIAFAADKFMIETLLPKKEHHIIDENVHHTFDGKVAVEINDKLDTMLTIGRRATGDSQPLSNYTLLGTEGLARTDAEATQELVVEDTGPDQPSLPFCGEPTPKEVGSVSGEPDPTHSQ